MEGKRMDELELPPMVVNNEDPKGTAFSVSVDATKEHGTLSIASCMPDIKSFVSAQFLFDFGPKEYQLVSVHEIVQ
jgi:3,4-dihydroxy 2-butanone 4-phosphate synthase/GTP cyclohydrolase II